MKLSAVIDELTQERGLGRDVLSGIICEGMAAAYAKRYPHIEFRVTYDPQTDDVSIFAQKKVIASVEDENVQISLRRARAIDPAVQLDSELWVPFENGIGRIEILRAKQVIASRIKHIEADAIYQEYKSKEGSIVHGVVHKCERAGVIVKIGEDLAFLPKYNAIPTDRCVVGMSIRALLKEVLPEPRYDHQLILDRASINFVQHLFALEIPEIYEELVEIKKMVRSPGYKTKVAVVSHDKNIDPVGTCVGLRGVRIMPILAELGSEKIDIISWSDDPERLVSDALKPAVVNQVEVGADRVVRVWVDEDQRSLAIGKNGQNISLASELSGLDVQLVQNAVKKEDMDV